MEKILVIDDSLEYLQLSSHLLKRQFLVDTAATLGQASLQLENRKYALIVLDINMPDGSGFDFLNQIQMKFGEKLPPVVFMSGRITEQDKIMGWSLGVDDYITKPFSSAEFIARIKNRVEKSQRQHHSESQIKWNQISANLEFHEVTVTKNGIDEVVDLSPIEFKILYLLMKNEGRVLSRDQIIDYAWGAHFYVSPRTVDKHVSMIRSKIKSEEANIKTISGLGYKLLRLNMRELL